MTVRQIVISVALLATASAGFAQLSVYVWQENLQDRVVYHYRVDNPINHGLLGLEVGADQLTGGDPRLTVMPIGAVVSDDLSTPDDIEFPIPLGSLTTPAGWKGFVVAAESDVKTSLLFSVADTAVLRAGTHRGFSVSVPTADNSYRTGQWKAVMEYGVVIWGALKPDDIDAPMPAASVSGGGTACAGVARPVSAALTGNGPWTLQWSDGQTQTSAISPATRSVAPQSTTRYTLTQVSDVNRSGAANGFADMIVPATAAITAQPQNKAVKKGTTTTLSVTANGAGPLSYAWYGGTTGVTSAPVGTNSSSFTTPKITAPKTYWVRVTNPCGSTDSTTASITLQ